MRAISALFLTILIWCWPITSELPNDDTNIDWNKSASVVMQIAHYAEPNKDFISRWLWGWTDEVLLSVVENNYYSDFKNFDLLKPLKIKGNKELEKLRSMNDSVNHLFGYSSNILNYWYAEPPAISIALGFGDCKAYAFYKYWTLRQMGYKNVKLITVTIPDGAGSLANHVVVILNDLWIFDINYPYFYPFEVLRENSALRDAYFSDGTIWDVK